MFDQFFDTFRKAAESSMQQDMFKQWAQPWPFPTPGASFTATDWTETVRKRWLESATGALNSQRELMNSLFRSTIQMLEQSFRMGGAKSPGDYQRTLEELWNKMSESFKEQSEAQLREFQKAAERWTPTAAKAKS